MIRIIHTADLHLDREAFEYDRKICQLRKKELRALFANIMIYARAQKADVLLFAGDLLDVAMPENETVELLLREFENSPETEIFIAPGRCDAYRPGSFYAETRFPANVHIFKEETLTSFRVERLNLNVYGSAFCHRARKSSPLGVVPTLDKSAVNLFVGQTSLQGDPRMAPTSEAQIAASGFDYLALGGEHAPSDMKTAGESRYAVAGCPEGTGFEDEGDKSIRIIALDKAEGEVLLQSKCVGFARRAFYSFALTLTPAISMSDAAEKALAFCREKGLDAQSFLRVRLTGALPYTYRVDESAFERVRSRVGYLELIDDTEAVMKEQPDDDDFIDVFAQAAAGKAEGVLRSKILKVGIAALEDRS